MRRSWSTDVSHFSVHPTLGDEDWKINLNPRFVCCPIKLHSFRYLASPPEKPHVVIFRVDTGNCRPVRFAFFGRGPPVTNKKEASWNVSLWNDVASKKRVPSPGHSPPYPTPPPIITPTGNINHFVWPFRLPATVCPGPTKLSELSVGASVGDWRLCERLCVCVFFSRCFACTRKWDVLIYA